MSLGQNKMEEIAFDSRHSKSALAKLEQSKIGWSKKNFSGEPFNYVILAISIDTAENRSIFSPCLRMKL